MGNIVKSFLENIKDWKTSAPGVVLVVAAQLFTKMGVEANLVDGMAGDFITWIGTAAGLVLVAFFNTKPKEK